MCGDVCAVMQVLQVCGKALAQLGDTADAEAVYRVLVGVGTLVGNSDTALGASYIALHTISLDPVDCRVTVVGQWGRLSLFRLCSIGCVPLDKQVSVMVVTVVEEDVLDEVRRKSVGKDGGDHVESEHIAACSEERTIHGR